METNYLARIKKKARREGRTIVFIDESGLSTRPHRVRTWAPRGQTPVIQETFGWKSLSVIAGMTLWNFYFQIHSGSIKSEQVVEFLKSLLRHLRAPLLILWDDPFVKQLARGVLEAMGYKVLSASNGRDALHVADEHKGSPISMVITDVIMPLMGGKVMAESLMASHPDLKVLFTSGYTDDTIAHHGVLDEGIEFLSKPYTPATLARKVCELLDKEAA